MAGSPRWKIYDRDDCYQAACKEVEAAAALVSFYGNGAQIRDGHAKSKTVFIESFDGDAGSSYDEVADIVYGVLHRRKERGK